MKFSSSPFRAFLLTLRLLLGAAGRAWGQSGDNDLPELGDSASTELSMQAEKRIGQEIMIEIRRNAMYLDDPEVEAYLNRLGNRLSAASPDPGIGFHFFPVDDPMINAFAMFGGYIGVNSGLVLAVQNESELAGVLAHEISHVTQRHLARGIARQKQIGGATLLALAAAILAAHSNPDAMGAAVTGVSAGGIQAQLGFSRDFEREADRVGFQTLQKAGFDVRGMSAFFSRLQRATRVYENNAPVYLRTHPLSTERISDMQNRELNQPYRQVSDSLEFQLTRARLQAMRSTANEAATHFQALLAEQKTLNAAATQYGLAVALARKKDWAAAENILNILRQEEENASPMIDRLYAEARVRRGDLAGGLAAFQEALHRYPDAAAVVYSYGEALLENRRFAEARAFFEQRLRKDTADARFYKLQARACAALGKTGQQHQALAEAYALEGALPAAIEQLELAQRAKDNDFYTSSAIDARLRQLKQRQAETK